MDIISLIMSTFKRNKKNRETRALAVLFYMVRGSFRKASEVISTVIEPMSKSAIHYLVEKMSNVKILVEPKERRIIAVDETKLKVKGNKFMCGML